MKRQCLRKLLGCAVVGALGGGILLRLTSPPHIGTALLLGAILGILFCVLSMLYQCMTKNGNATCRVIHTDSWFNRLCDNHPLVSLLFFIALSFTLWVLVRLALVVLGWSLYEVWLWITEAIRVIMH